MPRDAIACPSVVQHIYLSVSKSNKQRRQQPLMHLYSSFSSLFWFLPIPTPCSPIISLPFSQFPPHLSHPLSLSLVHSSVSLKRLLLETSKGSIKGNDWACISLFFSLPFALLRMPDYRSLHGLSGADRRLSWRGRQRKSGREDPVSPPVHVHWQHWQQYKAHKHTHSQHYAAHMSFSCKAEKPGD